MAVLLVADPAVCENIPTFRGNAEHTGIYDAAGVPALNGVKWTFKAAGQLIASPTVAGSTVYIGSTAGVFYAVDRESGSAKWKFAVKARVASTAAVANGMVFFGAYDGNFYALDAVSGTLKWKFATEGERRYAASHLHGSQPAKEVMPDPFDCYLSSPVVWNGAVYFGSGDGNVYALDAGSGALKWKFKTGDVVHASPAIADGKVYIGSWDSNFYALDAAMGKEVWRFKTGEDPDIHNQVGIQSSAAVVDGVVYFGCRDAHLYALDAKTGEKKWAYGTKGSWVIASPAVRDGKVFFATSDSGMVYALDARSGDVVFSLNLQRWPSFSSPAIAENTLYEGSDSGHMNAVDLVNRKIAWSFETEAAKKNGAAYTKADGSPNYEAAYDSDFYDDMMAGRKRMMSVGPILSSPVVADKVVYFGGTDGMLYALD
ncbi:PQQ-binding-like beta-propeller repeat protein [Occallatibacter savannae]|uniref:PQQ-binding-like beta-propeller repeat protein n=1 Tax=Occallatibacter savannae TaxID=1002691 RepID=UPI001EF4E68D|nr:PQQ-binding-like beta-propeller repeat protein [Occallatibacter savannae]